MKRWLIIALGIVVVLAIAAAVLLIPPTVVPEGEQSAAIYESGDLGIAESMLELVDESRPTRANGTFPGADSRTLAGVLWRPADTEQGPYPLIVYSHGFMSSVEEARYYAEHLVPKGYIVAAVNYPLSNGQAPGGPNARDIGNQPGDVSFVMDALLSRNDTANDPLHGQIDPERIAVAGLSLGGLTAVLSGFHPQWSDCRVKAVAAIAAPTATFGRGFFGSSDVPFLLIAGSADAIVPYDLNAAPIPRMDDNAILVTLENGSHVGFAAQAAAFARWADHPDEMICPRLLENLNRLDDAEPWLLEPNDRQGIVALPPDATPCARNDFGRAMRPARQLMLTRLALHAFLDSVLAPEAAVRSEMRRYLTSAYEVENSGTTVTVSGRTSDAASAR